jgi:F0F1-type ATP synthase assembly protein I
VSADSFSTSELDANASQQPSEPTPFSRQVSDSSGSYELVLSGVVLGLGGYFLDQRVGTTPLFMLVFTFVGLFGSAVSIYYRYRHRIETLQQEAAAMRAQAARS